MRIFFLVLFSCCPSFATLPVPCILLCQFSLPLSYDDHHPSFPLLFFLLCLLLLVFISVFFLLLTTLLPAGGQRAMRVGGPAPGVESLYGLLSLTS